MDLTFRFSLLRARVSLSTGVATGYEPNYDKYSFIWLVRIILNKDKPMSGSREFLDPLDDFIVIKADIDDSPSVEIPLIELFDLATFTLVDNYQQVLHGYVIELLEDTTWMDETSCMCLLCSGYGISETGQSLPMERRELQQFILRSLRHCQDTSNHQFVAPLLINFLMPYAD